MLNGAVDTAQLHLQMRLGQAAIAAGPLQGGPGIGKFAESMDGNTRHGTFVRCGAKTFDLRGLTHVWFRFTRYWATVEAPADCSVPLSEVCFAAWVTSPLR